MPGALIEVDNVRRIYTVGDVEVPALDGVTLRIDRGEFVAIMGASGSGKSTLMSILGCLDRPSSGAYRFEGLDVSALDEPALAQLRSERLGFVFQSFNLLARTSAIENVGLPLFYAQSGSRPAAERSRLAHEALSRLGLADREGNTPGQLSGGQQQRVALARALINEPHLLLADEPTGNLDTRTSHEIMETLRTLNRQGDLTIVVVTHESDIAAYADRVVTMRDGRIISDTRTKSDERHAALPASMAPLTGAEDQSRKTRVRVGAFASMIAMAAIQVIARNKLRSALTMLGVFIGVAALIAMVDLGQGANEAVRRQIENLGTNLVVVTPGAANRGGIRGGFGSASSLTVADAQAIQREDSAVGQVAYMIRQSGQVQAGSHNWTTNIQGVTDNYSPITNWQIRFGRGLTDSDVAGAALVAVIGQTVSSQLFGAEQNPVGAIIKVKNVPMQVVGIFASKGQTGFGQDQDDLVMVPFTTAERKIIGTAAPSQQQQPLNWQYPAVANPYNLQPRLTGLVNQIYVQAVDQSSIGDAIDEITATLALRHHIKKASDNDFSVRNLSQIADTAAGASQTFAMLLSLVASISLLVGGIGIMNILLVSVTERTREIGLRMAIGARRIQVMLQFLAEAVFLSVTGGVAGALTGALASLLLSAIAGWPAPISPIAIIGGFLFSASVGVFFGYYPARKAARLDPIAALRFE